MTKIKTFYIKHKTYLDLTFTLVTVSLLFALHKGHLKEAVDILNVAKALIGILAGVPQ